MFAKYFIVALLGTTQSARLQSQSLGPKVLAQSSSQLHFEPKLNYEMIVGMIDNDGNDKIDWQEVTDFFEAIELDYGKNIDPKIKEDMHEMFLLVDSDKDG